MIQKQDLITALADQGKSANILITGVSSGIGYATAKISVTKGARVFGSVRRQADAERLKSEFGEKFTPLIFDLRSDSDIQSSVSLVEQEIGNEGLACIVNNAGVGGEMAPLQHINIDSIKDQMDINVYGPLRIIQAFLPLLGAQIPQKYPPGKIINITSVSGFFSAAFIAPYTMSKHALESLSDSLRRELTIFDIDVVVIQPGATDTELLHPQPDEEEPLYSDTAYGPLLGDKNKRLESSRKNALPPEAIAETVEKILTAEKPRPAIWLPSAKTS